MSLLHRAYALTDLEVRAEGRTMLGTVVPFGVEANIGPYRESFARGAFAGTDPASVPLLVAHRHAALPIGHAAALHDEPDRLAGEFALSHTRDAEEVLALAADGVPLGLSVGFAPGEDRWSPNRRSVVRLRATLAEVSVVGVPAYRGAMVQTVRAASEHDAPLLRLAQLLR